MVGDAELIRVISGPKFIAETEVRNAINDLQFHIRAMLIRFTPDKINNQQG